MPLGGMRHYQFRRDLYYRRERHHCFSCVIRGYVVAEVTRLGQTLHDILVHPKAANVARQPPALGPRRRKLQQPCKSVNL